MNLLPVYDGLCNSIIVYCISCIVAVLRMANASHDDYVKMIEYLPFNHFYGNQLLESVLRINVDNINQKSIVSLTKREPECLFCGSEGKTAWEISGNFGISERTVVFSFPMLLRSWMPVIYSMLFRKHYCTVL